MNNISVDIFGDNYSFASDGDTEEISKYAKYLDEKLNQLKSNTSIESKYKLAILCSLNIIEELFSKQKEISQIENNFSRITNLLNSYTEENPQETKETKKVSLI